MPLAQSASGLPDRARASIYSRRVSVRCPSSGALADCSSRKSGRFAGTSEAADGTRTHDLLHGKQLLNRVFRLSRRDAGRSATCRLLAITVDLGNEWVTEVRTFRKPAAPSRRTVQGVHEEPPIVPGRGWP